MLSLTNNSLHRIRTSLRQKEVLSVTSAVINTYHFGYLGTLHMSQCYSNEESWSREVGTTDAASL